MTAIIGGYLSRSMRWSIRKLNLKHLGHGTFKGKALNKCILKTEYISKTVICIIKSASKVLKKDDLYTPTDPHNRVGECDSQTPHRPPSLSCSLDWRGGPSVAFSLSSPIKTTLSKDLSKMSIKKKVISDWFKEHTDPVAATGSSPLRPGPRGQASPGQG